MKFSAEKADGGCTVGLFLLKKGVSKRTLTRLKRVEGGIKKNGVHCRTIDLLSVGDEVELFMEDEKHLEPNGELEVRIAYEEEGFAVFDKPPMMPVHPSIKHQGDTLGNYFAYRYPKLTFRPVNRLDRDTSGLCVVAKDRYYANALQFAIKKTYYAIVAGIITEAGTVDAPIARERESIIKRVVSDEGQRAVTHYRPVGYGDNCTLVEISLETGRTHQIRVHFCHIGFPLLGDGLYGKESSLICRQALHCGRVEISLPNREILKITADFPQDFKKIITTEGL